MKGIDRILGMIAIAALASAIAACSTDLGLNDVTLAPKPESLLRKPDWATFSGGKNDFALRPVTTADLVDAQGQCGSGPGAAVGAGGVDPAAGAAPARVAGGIALQMTECDVVGRAGAAEKIDFATDEGGDRIVVLSYARGPWPGIYRFRGGRLVSVERAPAPPPPAKAQKAIGKKPAGS
jgi:hypothetical protein